MKIMNNEAEIIVANKYRLPYEVIGTVLLRANGILGITAFYREMRRYGLSPAKAQYVYGRIINGDYKIITEEGKELSGKKAQEMVYIAQYRFLWVFRLKYLERKGHEIILEIEIEGAVQKHYGIDYPLEGSIMSKIDEEMMLALEKYFKDFWSLNLRSLLGAIAKSGFEEVRSSYVSGVAEFELEKIIESDKKVDLDGFIYDITFNLKRKTDTSWVKRKDLERDLFPYAEMGVKNVVSWIMETEATTIGRAKRKMMKKAEDITKRAISSGIVSRVKSMIERSDTLSKLETTLDFLMSAYASKLINEEVLNELINLINDKINEIAEKYVNNWCKRFEKCVSIAELNDIYRRIVKSATYNSQLFIPFQSLVDECYQRKLKELSKLKKMKKSEYYDILASQLAYRLDILKNIPCTEPGIITNLLDLIKKIEKYKISEKQRERLLKMANKILEEKEEEKCRIIFNRIESANKVRELMKIKATVRSRKKEYFKCYDEIMKTIDEKIEKIRYETYTKICKRFIEEYCKLDESEKIKYLYERRYTLYRMPYKYLFPLIEQMIDCTNSIEVLETIKTGIIELPTTKNPEYIRYRNNLVRKVDDKVRKLTRGDLV